MAGETEEGERRGEEGGGELTINLFIMQQTTM